MLLDAPGALPALELRVASSASTEHGGARPERRVGAAEAAAAAAACLRGPDVKYAHRPLNGRMGATAEVFVGIRKECPHSNTNECDRDGGGGSGAGAGSLGGSSLGGGGDQKDSPLPERGAGGEVVADEHPRCAAMERATRAFERMRSMGVWEQSHCPMPLGRRRDAEVPREIGTACEPWIHRGIQFVLSRLLGEEMHALEWSTGSSSMYYLMLVASLHSVEHDPGWAQLVRSSMGARLPAAMASRWTLDTIANSTPYGRDARMPPNADDSLSAFAAYVNVALRRPSFDFVSVDGRARSACLERVWREQLVAPGGILLLDNSLRAQYRQARTPFDEAWSRIEFNASKTVHPEAASVLWCRRK